MHELPSLARTRRKPVFGESKATAAMVIFGEQPGDQEDRSGRKLPVSPVPA